MPNRFLKESICRSDEIEQLSWLEEVLFYRLIVSCDDFGRFDARTKIIKGQCFPLKDITEKDIGLALKKLSSVGLITVYKAEGRQVLQMVTWDKHQSRRAKESKYPAFTENCVLMYADENDGSSGSKKTKLQRMLLVEEPSVITLTLNTGEEYSITQSYVNELMELYPAVDIMQELRTMKGWCNANPQKRKTSRGIKRFINSWLAREQNGSHCRPMDKGAYQQAASVSGYSQEMFERLANESRGDFGG